MGIFGKSEKNQTLKQIELRVADLQNRAERIELRLVDLQERDPENSGLGDRIMASLEELKAADDALDAEVNNVVAKLDELTQAIVDLQAQVAAGIDPSALDEEVAELARKTEQIRAALAPPA